MPPVYTGDMSRHAHAAANRSLAKPMDVPPDLDAAARVFVPDATSIAPVGNGGLVRVETPSGVWSVRRWRPGTTEDQIRFVHDHLRALRGADIEIVPEVRTLADGGEVFVRDGVLYDAQSWLPGSPIARQAPERGPGVEHVNLPLSLPPAQQVELIEAVARLHEASAPLARTRSVPEVPLAAVAGAVRDAWERARVRLRPVAPMSPHVQRWIRAGERALRVAMRDVAEAPAIYRDASVVAHNDLWPVRVLWSRPGRGDEGGTRLSGIVGWVDAAAGSPLLDLAQLVGHFGGWTATTAEDAIGAYVAVRRLGPDERRLLPAVAVLDLVAEAGWLLSVAYADPSEREASSQLRDGVESIVSSLEQAAEVAVRGDRPQTKGRRWVHREPPGKVGDRRRSADDRPRRPVRRDEAH
jgi:Ser/Thr protein kinase RdoA (MazF antagonist)